MPGTLLSLLLAGLAFASNVEVTKTKTLLPGPRTTYTGPRLRSVPQLDFKNMAVGELLFRPSGQTQTVEVLADDKQAAVLELDESVSLPPGLSEPLMSTEEKLHYSQATEELSKNGPPNLERLRRGVERLAEGGLDEDALRSMFEGELFSVSGLAVEDSSRPSPRLKKSGKSLVKAAEKALPAELAAKLSEAASLPKQEADALLDDLALRDIRVRGPPAFAEDTTFSLELEFQVSRQLRDEDLRELFTGKEALTKKQWAEWRRSRSLPPKKYEKAWLWYVSRLQSAMPPGWRLTNPAVTAPDERMRGGKNTLEINTGNAGGVYHENTTKDWDELRAALARVQDLMPGGLYSVQMHVGRKSLSPQGLLKVDADRLMRFLTTYQGMLRALAGLGYAAPRQASYGNEDQMNLLGDEGLLPGAGRWASQHGLFINLHERFPTLENRILSGLMKRRADGSEYLDAETFAADAWWAFALLDAVARRDLPLATLGLPVHAGYKPSAKQILHFVDVLFEDDAVGKALALKRFAELRRTDGAFDFYREERRETSRRAYEKLGLGVVFELHAEHDGWDERLREHLLEDDGRGLSRLAKDLSARHADGEAALSLFPPDIQEDLRPVLALARSPLMRALLWVKRASGIELFLRRLTPSPEFGAPIL